MTLPDPHRLSAADVIGLLAEPERRQVFAALILGARTLPEVAAATHLPASETAMALQKLVAGGLVTIDSEREHYKAAEAPSAPPERQTLSAGRGRGP